MEKTISHVKYVLSVNYSLLRYILLPILKHGPLVDNSQLPPNEYIDLPPKQIDSIRPAFFEDWKCIPPKNNIC